VEEFFEISGMNYDELKAAVDAIRKSGRMPFFHFTSRAGAILKGPLIDEILSDLYPLFNKRWHVGFLVPNEFKSAVEKDIEGYGG